MAEMRKTSASSQQQQPSPKKEESKDGGVEISASSSKPLKINGSDGIKKKRKNASATTNPAARRRKRKEEEEYTDKDRAAAVNLWSWSRDIKHSLKMAQRNRERQQRLLASSDPAAAGAADFLPQDEDDHFLAAMFLAEASHQVRIKKDVKAGIDTLDKALDICPDHKGALVARSKYFLKLGDALSALRDAENCFDYDGNGSEGASCCGDGDEKDVSGLYEYAEALYNLGRFEEALIAYHRGYRIKDKGAAFRIGIQKTEEAIQRSIGDGATKRLKAVAKILQKFQQQKLKAEKLKEWSFHNDTEHLSLKYGAVFGLDRPGRGRDESGGKKFENLWPRPATSSGKVKEDGCESKSASAAAPGWGKKEKDGEELLGRMYLDKKYLTKLIQRLDIRSQDGATLELCRHANEGLNYLKIRERFWRQQNPFYSRNNYSSR